jgi:hypothetical protein
MIAGEGHPEMGRAVDEARKGTLISVAEYLRKIDLAALCKFETHSAHSFFVISKRTDLRPEFLENDLREASVDIDASELSVTGGSTHRKVPARALKAGNVEGSSTKVEDDDPLLRAVPGSVRQRGGGWLIEEFHVPESSEERCLEGCKPLMIIEMGGNGDDRPSRFLSKIRPRTAAK